MHYKQVNKANNLLLEMCITHFILVLQVSFWHAVHLVSLFFPSFMVTYMTENKNNKLK